VHAAAEIQFALAYTNGTDPATIIDIDQKNVQAALESYFSKVGIPITELALGVKNCVNVSFTTTHEFIPGSLQVILSSIDLNGIQTDPNRDFDVHPDNKSFTLLLDPTKPYRLNAPPRCGETLFVRYNKRITFNTRGGT
jgi:hypothetical protein